MRISPVWRSPKVDVKDANVETLRQTLDLHPVIAQILVSRGFTSPELASQFLHPSLDQLHDPFLLTDLGVGVDRVLAAIASSERIAVHGDYDVDGVTSTVMLRRLIELLGGDVVHHIPDRLTDGYGLQVEGIDRLKALGVRVAISVDCGIRSQAAAARAKDVGIDLVITDHHEPETTLPPAFAVINPRRHDCRYPDKDLAGVGVAFKLVQGLCARTDRTRWIPGFLKLAAFGTLADVVPLRGENRVIASLGLERLTRGPHTVGLRSLIEVCGLSGKKIGSSEVGFQLAPRVNAAGRMSTPDLATRLLLSVDESDAESARDLARKLDDENTRRRQEEAAILDDARRRIVARPEIAAQNLIVIWGDGWHRGVIGIVASKLVDQFCRPVVVLSVDGDIAHGSGRSIPGFDLLSALEECADLFVRFGGHRQAAGLTIETSRLPELQQRLVDHANELLGPDDLAPRLRIDAHVSLSAIDQSLMDGLTSLEPFGAGNRRPVFHADPVEIVDGPHTMKDVHLRMTVKQGRSRFRAVSWRDADRQRFYQDHSDALNVAFSLTENTFRGRTSIELNVADVK
jgi:single-stranded-DNA-specific exonuclease